MADNFKSSTGNETIPVDLDVGDDVSIGDDLAVAGDLTVAGTSAFTGKITGDDIDLASGAVVAGLGTGANGIKLKNLKNQAASTLSGTELEVEIDIAGTPYYFKVYPTSS